MGETKDGKRSIERVVRLRQMIQRWRKEKPAEVPAGHVAVCVGRSSRRFVVRVVDLHHPIFRNLLERAEVEYGFSAGAGPLSLPCDECSFEDALRYISNSASQRTKTKLSSSSSSFLPNLQDLRNLRPRCCQVAGGLDDEPPLFRPISENS